MGMEKIKMPPTQNQPYLLGKNGFNIEMMMGLPDSHLLTAITAPEFLASPTKNGKKKSYDSMKDLVLCQYKIIDGLQKKLVEKEQENERHKLEIETLRRRLDRSDRRSIPNSSHHDQSSLPTVTPKSCRKRRRSDSSTVQKGIKRRINTVTSPKPNDEAESAFKPDEYSPNTDPALIRLELSRLNDVTSVVSVPSYRVIQLTPLPHGHTVESMSDESYIKRHLKHEKHERQIVRRDKVRQRAEQMKERLEASPRFSMYTGRTVKPETVKSDDTNEEEESEIGNIEQISTIEISKRLPKNAILVKERDPLHRTRDSLKTA